jgi:hypothetical protein
MHAELGGHRIGDIDVVAAFDIVSARSGTTWPAQ